MYLLRYRRDGELRAVVIADAYSVAHARMVAAELEPGTFVDGHRVSRASVARLPIDGFNTGQTGQATAFTTYVVAVKAANIALINTRAAAEAAKQTAIAVARDTLRNANTGEIE